MNLSQTDKIFGALLIGFVIFVTVKGELPKYIQLMTSPYVKPPTAVAQGSSSGGILGDLVGKAFGSLFGSAGSAAGSAAASTATSTITSLAESFLI